MNLNKLNYNVLKRIKKMVFKFSYIEKMGSIPIPHKLLEFKINDVINIEEYLNLFFNSEFYNINSDELINVDIDDLVDNIFNKILDCYSDKIYDYIYLTDKYMDNNEDYFLTVHQDNKLYNIIAEYVFDNEQGCFISCNEINFEKVEGVFL